MNENLTEQQRNQLEALAEEYAERQRQGEDVSIDDYLEKYPKLASDIRQLFPVVLMLDQAAGKVPTHQQGAEIHAEIGPGTKMGEYQLIRPIGRGGMGVVYQAEHIVLGSDVAIKLLPSTTGRTKLRERFQREASAAARMHHPNIVRVFDFGTHRNSVTGETLYYVMSLVDGWGLDRIIGSRMVGALSQKATTNGSGQIHQVGKAVTNGELTDTHVFLNGDPAQTDAERNGRDVGGNGDTPANSIDGLPKTGTNDTQEVMDPTWDSATSSSRQESLWVWVAKVGVQVADALDYAHSMGVVHRDIKPSNLMIDADNTVYVTDFGLAKVADDSNLTATGDVMGTLRYMPPEAFSGRADHRSDIYGLGLTLYELLCKEQAFGESDRAKLIPAITEGQITRLRKRAPKIPLDLETIVHKAIDVQPSSRYETAAEFCDDLHRFLNGQPVKARRATWAYSTARWIGRNRVVSALAASVMLLLATAAIISATSAKRFEKLAGEKELESIAARIAEKDAVSAENEATAQTREAKLNLLAAKVSDARGWSTSRLPGQRVEGINALKEAITSARELNAFDQYRLKINEIAATLATLCDIPDGVSWRHPTTIPEYIAIGFNHDLSIYASVDYRDGSTTCKIFSVKQGQSELIETIPLPAQSRLDAFSINFAADSSFICAELRDKNDRFVPWIYDFAEKKTILPDFQLGGALFRSTMSVLRNKTVVFIDSQNRLVGFDVPNNKVTFEYPLPKTAEWTHLYVSHDSRQVAIHQVDEQPLIVVDLETMTHSSIEYDQGGITRLAWRPDGNVLAILSGDVIRVWDIESSRFNTLSHSHTRTTHFAFSGDGRYLVTTGWDHTTLVHDTHTELPTARVEMFMQQLSEDGTKVVLHEGSRFEIRPLITPDVNRDYFHGGQSVQLNSTVDVATGTLWTYNDDNFKVFDLSNNRVLWASPFADLARLDFDPQGRDIVVKYENNIYRIPINWVAADSRSSADANKRNSESQTRGKRKVQFGPPELILTHTEKKPLQPEDIQFGSNGDRLAFNVRDKNCMIVLDRNQDWKQVIHSHAENWPIRVHVHPTLPLFATSVHHSTKLEVRNYRTDKVVFSFVSKQSFATFTPDGSKLVVGHDGKIRTFDVKTWQMIAETEGEVAMKHENCAISSDSRWIAAETQNPRGVVILDSETLIPALLLRGNHIQPKSTVAQFDPTGRFLVCNRGKEVVGTWDLYKLRQHFDSLGLEWPLEGLGNPTPLRDPSIPVEVNWEVPQHISPDSEPTEKKAADFAAQLFHSVNTVLSWFR